MKNSSFGGRTRAWLCVLSALAMTAALTSCRTVIDAHGTDVASAKANADALAMALEHRFTNVERAPKYAHARMRLARYAFAPSKLINDTAIWTHATSTATGTTRTLELSAAFKSGAFRFDTKRGAALPARTGDERHLIKLAELGDNDWQWTTEVDHGVGSIAPSNVEAVFQAIFKSLERSESSLRNDYRSVMPTTTAAFGRLMTLDSLVSVKQADGSFLVRVALRVNSDKLRAGFPNFAKYVNKYMSPSSMTIKLLDNRGDEWFIVSSKAHNMSIQFRSNNGKLQPIETTARAMPDTLAIHIDARAKLGMFSVGISKMHGEFVHVDNARERAWRMRFTNEPKWHLPLISERLLRSPLRRPFEGQGVQFKIGFRTSASGETLFSRDLNVVVRESAIMRFLGNLGFGAMNDFAGLVEKEENQFLAELFAAIRTDVRNF